MTYFNSKWEITIAMAWRRYGNKGIMQPDKLLCWEEMLAEGEESLKWMVDGGKMNITLGL